MSKEMKREWELEQELKIANLINSRKDELMGQQLGEIVKLKEYNAILSEKLKKLNNNGEE